MQTMIITSDNETFYFDAVFQEDYESNVEITSHPVQFGAEITDHSYALPESLSMQIGLSDVMSSETNHSVNAFQRLKEIMYKREFLTVVTRFQTFNNMLIKSISTSNSFESMASVKAAIQFQQVEVVNVTTVKIQDKTTSSKSGGTVVEADEVESLEDDNNSILRRMFTALGEMVSEEVNTFLVDIGIRKDNSTNTNTSGTK